MTMHEEKNYKINLQIRKGSHICAQKSFLKCTAAITTLHKGLFRFERSADNNDHHDCCSKLKGS